MINAWTVAKDSIGFVGALAAAVPWFRDYRGRLRWIRIQGVQAGGGLSSLKAEIEENLEVWLARPKAADLCWMLGGLLLVAASFLIGLIQTLAS